MEIDNGNRPFNAIRNGLKLVKNETYTDRTFSGRADDNTDRRQKAQTGQVIYVHGYARSGRPCLPIICTRLVQTIARAKRTEGIAAIVVTQFRVGLINRFSSYARFPARIRRCYLNGSHRCFLGIVVFRFEVDSGKPDGFKRRHTFQPPIVSGRPLRFRRFTFSPCDWAIGVRKDGGGRGTVEGKRIFRRN